MEKCKKCGRYIFESSVHLCPCEICGGERRAGAIHRCPPCYEAIIESWNPDEPQKIHAYGGIESAAADFVKKYDDENAEGLTEHIVVKVRKFGEEEWQEVAVEGWITFAYLGTVVE